MKAPQLKLKTDQMLGFRLQATATKTQAKIGSKIGDKGPFTAPHKIGAKVGGKGPIPI